MELSAAECCNELSRRWASILQPEDDAVFSAPGAWVVLASLLAGADGVARDELEVALGVRKGVSHRAAASLLEQIAAIDSVTMAAGLWFNPKIDIHDSYRTRLHPVPVRPLPGKRTKLDGWVRSHTNGRIAGFVSEPTQFRHTSVPMAHLETMILVAPVLSAMADWTDPFMELSGTWGPGNDPCNWLTRGDRNPETAALISAQGTTVSRVICETRGGFDVHLLGGERHDRPGIVLGAGLDTMSGRAKIVSAKRLQEGDRGGCLTVRRVERFDTGTPLNVSVPAFELSTSIDLARTPEPFGITTALDPGRGHFPGISDTPLYLGRAEQSIASGFQTRGFYADALTEVEERLAGMPGQALTVDVRFDRPFGFLVVERKSGLVIFCGWVARVESGGVSDFFKNTSWQPLDDEISSWSGRKVKGRRSSVRGAENGLSCQPPTAKSLASQTGGISEQGAAGAGICPLCSACGCACEDSEWHLVRACPGSRKAGHSGAWSF